MMTWQTSVISSKSTACGAVLLTLTLVAMASTVSGQQVNRSSGATRLKSDVRRWPMPPPLRRASASWECSLGRTFPDELANS